MFFSKEVLLRAARTKVLGSASRRVVQLNTVRSLSSVKTAPKDEQKVQASVKLDVNVSEEASARETTYTSPSELVYTGDAAMPITTKLHIVTPEEDTPPGVWPIFRLMDEDGTFRDGSTDGFKFATETPELVDEVHVDSKNESLDHLRQQLKEEYPHAAHELEKSRLLFPSEQMFPDMDNNDTLLRAFTHMVRMREMDTILHNAQRQGRISFYMTAHGEEAIHLGAASALNLEDTVLAQYREQGVLMWRGFTLNQFTDQCFSTKADLGKGRQMPVHYGSKALNYQTISSPLGTQITQAAGAAYQIKRSGKDAIAACFFGDGCSSTTDFHSGLTFAATLNAPVMFFCRNNGYAISTPVTDQYAGDGIVSRAPGYGMAAIRVDGNDIFAVHAAVREAREYAINHSAPILVEAMSYRQGHHSTSDDSSHYRSPEEVQGFFDRCDPVVRLQRFLESHDIMTADDFAEMANREKKDVIKAMTESENKPSPDLTELFTDVYHEIPKSLKAQEAQLHEHLAKYPNQY